MTLQEAILTKKRIRRTGWDTFYKIREQSVGGPCVLFDYDRNETRDLQTIDILSSDWEVQNSVVYIWLSHDGQLDAAHFTNLDDALNSKPLNKKPLELLKFTL